MPLMCTDTTKKPFVIQKVVNRFSRENRVSRKEGKNFLKRLFSLDHTSIVIY